MDNDRRRAQFEKLKEKMQGFSMEYWALLNNATISFSSKTFKDRTSSCAMGVRKSGGSPRLHFTFDPDVWDKLIPDERVFLMLHNIQHQQSAHASRFKQRDKLTELAMDLEVNHSLLSRFTFNLPTLSKTEPFVDNVEPEGMLDSLTAEEYLFSLRSHYQNQGDEDGEEEEDEEKSQGMSGGSGSSGESEENDSGDDKNPGESSKGKPKKQQKVEASKSEESNDDSDEEENGEGSEESDEKDDGVSDDSGESGEGGGDSNDDSDGEDEDSSEEDGDESSNDDGEESEDDESNGDPEGSDDHELSEIAPEDFQEVVANAAQILADEEGIDEEDAEDRIDQAATATSSDFSMDADGERRLSSAAGNGPNTGVLAVEDIGKQAGSPWKALATRLVAGANTEHGKTSWLPNKRWQALGASTLGRGVFLPSRLAPEKKKIRAVIFLDTSYSCRNLVPHFWSLLRAIPEDVFEITTFTHTTIVQPFDPKKPHFPSGGTSYRELEAYFDREDGDIKYAFVFSDGDGDKFEPKNPKQWHFFMFLSTATKNGRGLDMGGFGGWGTTRHLHKDINVHNLRDYVDMDSAYLRSLGSRILV